MLSKFSDRICNLFEYLHDSDLKRSCRVESTDFTRNSPLNFVNLILIILTNGGKSNTLELIDFFDKIDELEVSKRSIFTSKIKTKAFSL